MPEQSIAELAKALDSAHEKRAPIPPLSENNGLDNVADAYAVQTYWTNTRLARGERIVGRKIGLTSVAIQQQLGVDEPDYGNLWETGAYPGVSGRVEVPTDAFLQPRVEGEIAFLIGRELSGPHVTLQDVLAATDAIALSVEIVASRIADWKIKLVDTIADNASAGGFALGPWDKQAVDSDIHLLGMTIHQNGELASEGVGAAAMGHPATAVAWLANKLSEFGVSLQAGDVILSGAVTRMLPVQQNDCFTFQLYGQPALTVMFT